MADEREIEIDGTVPVLEEPPVASGIVSGVGTLLADDDALGLATSKAMALESFISVLAKNHSYQDFMREILMTITEVIKSEAGSILEADYKHKNLFFRAATGHRSEKLSDFVIPFGQGIVGYVAESRQPLIVNNVEENKVHLKSIKDAIAFEAKNIIAVPLLIRGKVFGVVELLNRIGDEGYSSADLELMSYVCSQAAKIIEVRLMIGWAMKTTKAEFKAA